MCDKPQPHVSYKNITRNIAITKIDFHQAKITTKATSTKYTTVTVPKNKIRQQNRYRFTFTQSFKQNLYVLLFQIIGSAIVCATAELNRHWFRIEEKRVWKVFELYDNETLNTFHIVFQNIVLFTTTKNNVRIFLLKVIQMN